ncbi:hypothetical protein BDN70DRAFT_893310 [Pholiota conissans]|uniref:Uncharacterized protein n=1 Tax=Pholiota conissans TaxID=109636 RepID=A0A9P5Z4P0_9AGAR|nr:hypothetical protein BDN70DRAFT_893310 [Pholiota conissans]
MKSRSEVRPFGRLSIQAGIITHSYLTARQALESGRVLLKLRVRLPGAAGPTQASTPNFDVGCQSTVPFLNEKYILLATLEYHDYHRQRLCQNLITAFCMLWERAPAARHGNGHKIQNTLVRSLGVIVGSVEPPEKQTASANQKRQSGSFVIFDSRVAETLPTPPTPTSHCTSEPIRGVNKNCKDIIIIGRFGSSDKQALTEAGAELPENDRTRFCQRIAAICTWEGVHRSSVLRSEEEKTDAFNVKKTRENRMRG